MPAVRHLACLGLLTAAVALSGCGEDAPDGARVIVEMFRVDGEMPEGLIATRLTQEGPGKTYPLEPVPGGVPGEHLVRDAPAGRYIISAPGGWAALSGGRPPPELDPNGPAPTVRLGAPHTLYVVPKAPNMRPGLRWGAEPTSSEPGDSATIPVKVDIEPPDGYFAALRFPPDAWHGEIRVVGHLSRGVSALGAPDASPGPLTEPIRFKAREGGYPMVGQAAAAAVGWLDVVLIPASADVSVDNVQVRVEVLNLPLGVRYEEPTHRGIARFRQIPDISRPLLVSTPPYEHGFDFDMSRWQEHAGLYLLALAENDTREVTLVLPAGVEPEEVLVRPDGASGFGLVRATADAESPHHVRFRAPRGHAVVLVKAGRQWGRVEIVGEDAQTLTDVPMEQEVLIQGPVDGNPREASVMFFRQEGEEAVIGHRFVVRVTPYQNFEARLPTGTYHIEVHTPRGVWKRKIPVKAHTAGGQIHVPLQAR